MEVQYNQFHPGSTENTPVSLQRGISKIVVYILYAVLLLLLFILLLMTGVKFSQISNDVNEIKMKLSKAANNAPFAPSHERIIEPIYLDEITPVRGKCREGWVSYDKGCYFLSTTPEPWRNAETHCQRLKGHLLVINNVEELDYISKVVVLGENYWIGLVERHKEGQWSWVDGISGIRASLITGITEKTGKTVGSSILHSDANVNYGMMLTVALRSATSVRALYNLQPKDVIMKSVMVMVTMTMPIHLQV